MFPKLNLQPFWDDEGGGGGIGDVTTLPEVPEPSSEDLDALGGTEEESGESEIEEGTERPEPKAEPSSKPEAPDIDEEEDEEEEDKKIAAKPEDKSDEEGVSPEDLASIRALKKDYPDIFKKHPQLRVAVAEHRQFRNMFSSIDEAREATEAQQRFHQIRDQLIDKADFGSLLDEINQADGTAAVRMVRKVLPAILERSRDLYFEITEEPISQFIHAAYNRAAREGNQNLKNAALHFWKFFGKDGAPRPIASGPSEADQQMEQRIAEHEGKKYQDAMQFVNRDIQSGLTELIERSIDPKNSLKETTKKALVSELVRTIDQEVASDQNHMARVGRLWQNARRSSYASGHTSRIISAYLERAKQLLPKHARKVREELNIAVDLPKSENSDGRRLTTQRRENGPEPRPMAGGKPATPTRIRDTNPRSIDWTRTSDADILAGKAKLRR